MQIQKKKKNILSINNTEPIFENKVFIERLNRNIENVEIREN